MGFITFAQGVIFDMTNEEGRILRTDSGECLALDQIATMLVHAGVQHTTRNEAIADVQTRIEASDQQLEEGFQTVIHHLRACDLLASESQAVLSPSILSEMKPGELWTAFAHRAIPSQKQQDLSRECASWEVFLTGKLINDPLPPCPLSRRIYALSHVISILLMLGGYRLTERMFTLLRFRGHGCSVQQQEWKKICRSLSALHVAPPSLSVGLDSEMIERIARRELTWCQLATRIFAPTAMCLVRSVAFCAYLRASGFPAQLVIGRERFCLSDDDAFHAWVELTGQVINDHQEVQSGYAVMYRVPSPNTFSGFIRRITCSSSKSD